MRTWLLTFSTFVLALVTTTPAAAQLVFIPDVNMRAWLNSQVPGVVNGNGFMDIANPDVAGLTGATLEVTWSPSDLTGLEYLTSVTGLSLDVPQASCYLPAFPPGVTNLYMLVYSGNSLPPLPPGLHTAHFWEMPSLTALPTLPASLEDLTIKNLPLLAAIPSLPPALEQLRIEECPLINALPALPSSLEVLIVRDFPALGVLPPLPSPLEILYLTSCPVVAPLVVLPDSLRTFVLIGAPWTVLPPLPSTLFTLLVRDVPVSTIGPLPSSAGDVHLISMDQLTAVPAFPSKCAVQLEDLPLISSFPTFPDTLSDLTLGLAQFGQLGALPVVQYGLFFKGMPALDTLPVLPSTTLVAFGLNDMTGLAEVTEFPSRFFYLSIMGCPELECLPILPDTLHFAQIENSGVTCMPNQITMYDPIWGDTWFFGTYPNELPVCTELNSTCPLIDPDINVSVEETPAIGLQFSPNPALDQVVITGEEPGLRWMLHDAAGRVLREGRTQALLTVIGLNDLSAGVYQLRVQRENGWRTGRLVKR